MDGHALGSMAKRQRSRSKKVLLLYLNDPESSFLTKKIMRRAEESRAPTTAFGQLKKVFHQTKLVFLVPDARVLGKTGRDGRGMLKQGEPRSQEYGDWR